MAKALTTKAIEAATKGEKRKEIPDGLLPGLYLIIQPSGAKSWAIRYRHGGKPRKMVLGTVAPKLDGPEPEPVLDSPLTLAGARKIARDQLQIVAAGRDPATEKIAAKRVARDPATIDRDLFGTVARRFVDRYAKPKNRSWAESARLLGLRPDPDNEGVLVDIPGGLTDPKKWGKRRIQDISRRDVIDLLDGIIDRGAPVVAVRTLAALRKMFGWCVEGEIVDANPVHGLKPRAPVRSRDRVLSDDELARVWRTTRATPYPFGPAIRLLILTGARREEIGALAWPEVQGDAIRLEGERTKNAEPRTVPLSTVARQIVDALPTIGTYVFTTTGETPVSGWSKAKGILDDSADVRDWRIHDLRRTVATGLQRLGFRLEVIEAVLGHTSGSRAGIVGVYQRHAFDSEKREALAAWSRYVTLFGRPHMWAKVRDHLDAGDVTDNEREGARRERDREFCRMITAGGNAWSKYIVALARAKPADNVVAIDHKARKSQKY